MSLLQLSYQYKTSAEKLKNQMNILKNKSKNDNHDINIRISVMKYQYTDLISISKYLEKYHKYISKRSVTTVD
ncbi:MAG: hypothetical protein KFW09_00655 [Oscillospiraceae bacterium]|nr:hypothetical protein [Oscillospiraceae bacterium]